MIQINLLREKINIYHLGIYFVKKEIFMYTQRYTWE